MQPIDSTFQYLRIFQQPGSVTSKWSKDLEPALTTVRIPAQQIGRQAATTIALEIKEPDAPTISRNIAPGLIVRSTCRAI